MISCEVEHLDVSQGVARAMLIFAQLEKKQVPVVVEQALFLQVLKVIFFQLDVSRGLFGLLCVMLKPGLFPLRAQPIGASIKLVLLNPQGQADL